MSGSQSAITYANGSGPVNGAASVAKDLEQALLLVRVSTMKMLRLQLAIERRDRAVAMQAVDDLIELDAWMGHSAGRSADDDLMDAIVQEVDDQRIALLEERFGLAAGLVKRPPREWAEPEFAQIEEPAQDHDHYVLGPVDVDLEEEPAERRRSWLLISAVVLMLVAATIGGALALGWQPVLLTG